MAEAVVAQFRHDFLGPEFFALPQFRTVDDLLSRSARGLRFGQAQGEVRALLARLPHLDAAAQTVALLDVLRRFAADATAAPITGPGYAPPRAPCLLTATSLPVTEVAARSGYRNLSNFNRRFRESKGLRPTEYRAAHPR